MKNSYKDSFSSVKILFLVCASLILCRGFAANVAWNSIEVEEYYGGGGCSIHPYPYVSMTSSVVGDALVLWADAYEYMELSSSWVVANKGDVVSVAEMQKQSAYFYSADFNESTEPGDVHTDYPIALNEGESAYLAIISRTYSAPSDYDTAWVELCYAEGRLYAKSSAIDYDGGALTVGVVPEPTTALLVLIGGVGAFLKRRRRAHRARPTSRGCLPVGGV